MRKETNPRGAPPSATAASKLCIDCCANARIAAKHVAASNRAAAKAQPTEVSHEKKRTLYLHRRLPLSRWSKSSPKPLNSHCAGFRDQSSFAFPIHRLKPEIIRQALIPERGVRGRQPEGGQKLPCDASQPTAFNMSKLLVLETRARLSSTQHKAAFTKPSPKRRHRRRRASARSGDICPERFLKPSIYRKHRPKTFGHNRPSP